MKQPACQSATFHENGVKSYSWNATPIATGNRLRNRCTHCETVGGALLAHRRVSPRAVPDHRVAQRLRDDAGQTFALAQNGFGRPVQLRLDSKRGPGADFMGVRLTRCLCDARQQGCDPNLHRAGEAAAPTFGMSR